MRDQLRVAFARDGFAVVPDAVDREHVDAALRPINHWLGTEFDPANQGTYASRTYAPELTGGRAILDLLLETGGFEIAQSLVGRPLVRPHDSQIALRFPRLPGIALERPWPHIDGVASGANGVPNDGKVHNFTILVGVLLSDLPQAGNGNFTVWPGSHRTTASWFAENGTRVADAEAFLREMGELGLASAQAVEVTGHVGDLVLAHHLLLHAGGPNGGPNIRYAVFFRLSTEGHDALGDATLVDPWAEWDGMREA